MLRKRQKRSANEANNEPPLKRLKIDNDEVMANLDLDLNIVVGANNTPINVNHYADDMKEIKIDSHIYFEYGDNNKLNKNNIAQYNILWKNKVVLNKYLFGKYQDLIRDRNSKNCHFHQPSPKQIINMYKMAPPSLRECESCGTILYNIHKSVMTTTSEDSYKHRDRKKLQKELTNLTITNVQNIKTINYKKHSNKAVTVDNKDDDDEDNDDDDVNAFLEIDSSSKRNKNKKKLNKKIILNDEIDDYGWKHNDFHKISKKYRISPLLLIRDYLRNNFGVKPDDAKQICNSLSKEYLNINKNKNTYVILNNIKNQIFNDYKIKISINILQQIHYGIMFDCIRGYNQNIAWNSWSDKMIHTKHKILTKIFTKCKGKGGHFLEHTLVGKLRGIIDKINNLNKNNKNWTEIKILNETQQKMKILQLKNKQIKIYKQLNNINDGDDKDDEEVILNEIGWTDPPTPDLLFNRPIMINGLFINWMDSKNFLITHQDRVKYRKLMKQSGKYNKIFGVGAFVCLGFVKTHKKVKNDVILLDASYWKLSI